MTKKIKKLLKNIIVSVGICSCVGGFMLLDKNLGANTVKAEGLNLSEELQERYTVGEDIVLPTGEFVLDNGEKILAQVTVICPSGKAYQTTDFLFDEPGIYTLKYEATKGDKYYQEKKTFTVYETAYSFTGNGSSAEYGVSYSATEGLKVSLAEDEKLVFNTVLDLSSATTEDSFIEFFSAPEEIDRVECKSMYVRLIDVEDENNYVTIRNKGASSSWAYTDVGANGQDMVGRESASKLWKNHDSWGTAIYYKYYGKYNATTSLGGRYQIRWYYDAQNKAFYQVHSYNSPTGAPKIIADLDHPEYYETAWSGFTSGRVRVEIYCGDYYASKANFVVTKLGNVDLQEAYVVDKEGPNINIELCGYEQPPMAKVGEAYPVFSATAQDTYKGKCTVNVTVRRVLDNGTRVNVNVSDDSFVPNIEGTYEVVYQAKDSFGNLSEKVLNVEASTNKVISPVLSIEKAEQTTAFVGEKVYVPSYFVSGGTGNITVEMEAISLHETVPVNENGYFIPNKAGDYSVVYRACDYIGQKTTAYYNVHVELGQEPVFTEEAVLPKYFLSGSSYLLEEFFATNYAKNGEKVLANATITDANGTRVIEYGKSFVPVVEKHLDIVTLTYSAGKTQKIYTVPVVMAKNSDGKIALKNYFITEGTMVVPMKNGAEISAQTETGAWSFAKSQLASNFLIQFGVAENGNFDGLKIRLTDSLNEKETIEIQIIKTETQTTLFVGDEKGIVSFDWSKIDGLFTIAYNNEMFSAEGVNLPVVKDVFGNKFTGFSSNRVYVSVEFINAEVGAKYYVTTINNQLFNANGKDTLAPTIILNSKDVGGAFKLGETALIPSVYAEDVFSPGITLTLTVTDSKYNTVTSLDGVVLQGVLPNRNYQIKLETVGKYFVTYGAMDENGQYSEYSLVINVVDSVKPTISISGNYTTSATVGETFNLANVEVKDDVTDAENLYSYCVITLPTGKKEVIDYVSDAAEYTALVKGKYLITFVAIDEAGNMSQQSYVVTVA